MRDVMWIYIVFTFLAETAWSLEKVKRNTSFNLGSDGNLTCSSKPWNETLFVIWTLDLKYRKCRISFNNDGRSENSCNDGKSLRNTSSAQSYLHIPNFSADDIGLYKCESVYTGGNENYEILVAITVPPQVSIRLERKDNKMVAVCKAERGNPAANISWSHTGNFLPVNTQHDSNGFFTVESHLELPEGMDIQNLTCIIRHPLFEEDKILKPNSQKANFPWLGILIVVVVTLFLAGFIFFAQKKLLPLRPCRQSHRSPSKNPRLEDVEEVEPYASYIQRVNSIYN
ncbi:cell surface glycoprotein CD200 receptor 1-A isoform X2 [Amphiprion ocellaris]|uniref:Ig-like domain-containing protein n=1 Tax=Amphiprion ocellaris TaxID=80972 RepID=A0A3Q1AZ37_AMPOC|nr:cell surface glycoprotein CD200 receptor 1-A isoform X2 [Amphiprion ocellaris]